jgi:hypothetical protein
VHSCLLCPAWGLCTCPTGPAQAQIAPVASTAPAQPPTPALLAPKKRIDIRQKGASGEREVLKTLNYIIYTCMKAQGFDEATCGKALMAVQRNQNQSAVGGNDLCDTFGMSFEVKRQEALSINTWWKQCVSAAKPNNDLPVLVYRQNHGAWHVVTMGQLHLPATDGSSYGSYLSRVEIDWETFKLWFSSWVTRKLQAGELPRGITA